MKPTTVRWRILWLMVIGSMVSYVLRLNVSIAGDAMMEDLAITPVQFGLVLSAFAWGYAIFQLPGGLFGEWFGPRRTLTLMITAWGLLTLATAALPAGAAVTTIVGIAMVLRFLMGVTQAPIFPVTSGCSVRRWFPVREWAMPNALLAVGTTIGGVIAGPLVAFLVIRVGWRGSFLALAPLAFIGATLWWWYTRDEPAAHPHINAAEMALIQSEPPPAPDEHDDSGWRTVLVNRQVLLLTASYFCTNYVFYLFFNWFYYYLVQVRQFPPQVSGWFTGLQWGIGAAAALAGGVICDQLTRRRGVHIATRLTAMGGLFACAALLVAGAAANHAVTAVLMLSFSFACIMLVDTAYWVAAMVAGGHHAPAATGIMNTGGNVVGALGAVAVPLIAGAFGWFVAVASGALFALLAAALWLLVQLPTAPAPVHEPAAAIAG